MTERFFIDNRRKLAARLEEGSAAVLFAGKAPLKRGDEYYPFSPDRNFYYVTGVGTGKLRIPHGKGSRRFAGNPVHSQR